MIEPIDQVYLDKELKLLIEKYKLSSSIGFPDWAISRYLIDSLRTLYWANNLSEDWPYNKTRNEPEAKRLQRGS